MHRCGRVDFFERVKMIKNSTFPDERRLQQCIKKKKERKKEKSIVYSSEC